MRASFLFVALACFFAFAHAAILYESASFALNTTIAANTPQSYNATCSAGVVRLCNPVITPQSPSTPANLAFVPLTFTKSGASCIANMTQPVEVVANLYKVLISIACLV